MFGDHFTADTIAKIIYDVDIYLRQRFIRRANLHGENHYTQLFAENINNAFSGVLPSYVQSSVLRPGQERKFGCDCIIIFQFDNEIKIGLFEAKWPFRNNWDYPQPPASSHFTHQIDRQCKYKDDFAIWETFYDSRPLPNSYILNNNGSMCSWHKESHDFQVGSVARRTWTTIDVASLIGLHGLTFYQIIYTILMCKKGKRHNIQSSRGIVVELKDQDSLTIPIPLSYDGKVQENKEIINFMGKYGLSLYAAINLTDLGKKTQ